MLPSEADSEQNNFFRLEMRTSHGRGDATRTYLPYNTPLTRRGTILLLSLTWKMKQSKWWSMKFVHLIQRHKYFNKWHHRRPKVAMVPTKVYKHDYCRFRWCHARNMNIRVREQNGLGVITLYNHISSHHHKHPSNPSLSYCRLEHRNTKTSLLGVIFTTMWTVAI